VACVAFSENGYYLGSGAEGGGARIWDLRKLKCTKTLECTYLLMFLCVFKFHIFSCFSSVIHSFIYSFN
jgi:WD40 repeat protein